MPSEQLAVWIEQEVTAELPIRAELREAWLLVFEGQWTVRDRFEFGDGGAAFAATAAALGALPLRPGAAPPPDEDRDLLVSHATVD